MPARLLAYGGTSFSERRRIGQWPAIPEATLRDTYGLTANNWCFGVGTLGKQPFVILRQRQNVENRGGYPFSLLLDPGDEVWQRFGWNGAAIVSAILQSQPELLIQTPERCSSEALERTISDLIPDTNRAATNGSGLPSLLIASSVQSEPIVVPGERPTPDNMGAILDALPICFRLSAGWLVGGGAAHGRALGANLVIDDQATGDPERPELRTYAEAWSSVSDPALIEDFKTKPVWTWGVELGPFFRSLILLHDLESATDPDEALLDRIETKGQTTEALDRKIDQTATDLLVRGTEPLGHRATIWLLKLSLYEKRKLDPKTANRLHPQTTIDELRRFGIPPAKVPVRMQLSREMRVGIWADYLERLRADVGKNLATALDQLGPDFTPTERQQLAEAAIIALPASDEKLADWERLRKYPEMWALLQPALQARQPVQSVPLPVRRVKTREPDRSPELREALESLLFNSRSESVERETEELRARFDGIKSADLDDLIAENCATSGGRFVSAFSGKYIALGDVMSFLSESAQDRLIDCLAEHAAAFQSRAAKDINYAINNKSARNAYTAALARHVLGHRDVSRRLAVQLVKEPKQLEKALIEMIRKGPRA